MATADLRQGKEKKGRTDRGIISRRAEETTTSSRFLHPAPASLLPVREAPTLYYVPTGPRIDSAPGAFHASPYRALSSSLYRPRRPGRRRRQAEISRFRRHRVAAGP